jgi:hypothetical protein
MISWLDGDAEGDAVDAIFGAFDEGEAEVFAHSSNLCEVFYHVLADADEPTASAAIAMLKGRGLWERSDLDGAFWRAMAGNIVTARAMLRPDGTRVTLALGDAFGVALANRLGGVFVTKDRSEIGPLHDAGLVDAQFIRLP